MPKVKAYIQDLYRTVLPHESRIGYLRLDRNEGVPGLSERFVKSVFAEISSGYLSCYPEYFNLQEKIAFHNNLRPENILLANGSDAAIKYIFDAFASSGDKILLTNPTFEMYPVYCRMFKCQNVALDYRSDFTFPLEEYLNNIVSGVKIAIIVNPNNPTGSIIKTNDLMTVIKKSEKHDVLLIVDEAYFYFCPNTVIEKVKKFSNLIILRTFSKLCGMASARLGYIAASPEIIEGVRKVRPTYDVNGISVKLGESILDNEKIIMNLIGKFREGKEYLINNLSEAKIEFREGHANFVLIRAPRRVDEIMNKLKDRKILISGGFRQELLKDFVRVTVGDKKIMKEFWQAFFPIWIGKND